MDQAADHTFDAPIDAVWAMFTDEASHVAKFASMDHRDIEVLSCTRTDDSFTIEIQRVVDVELPGIAKKVMQPTNTVVSIDRWKANGDGTYSGTFELDTKGAPVEIRGTTHLKPAGDKTDYRITFELKVNVPLVGGKIANWAKGDAQKQIEMEFAAGDRWLAEHA